MKEYKGFYFSNDNYIYADVTNKIDKIFGIGIVKKVLYQIGYYYGLDEDYNKQTFEEYIDKGTNVLLEKINDLNFDDEIDIDGISIIIEFINGVSVKFDTSEWGRIKRR